MYSTDQVTELGIETIYQNFKITLNVNYKNIINARHNKKKLGEKRNKTKEIYKLTAKVIFV
jgi:hypothetical protein